jgi:hypothetical protein
MKICSIKRKFLKRKIEKIIYWSKMINSINSNEDILYISTLTGYKIYQIEPFELMKEYNGGSISLMEVYQKKLI